MRGKSSWPGPAQQIFCVRETGLDPEEHLEVIETAAVVRMEQLGRKLTVVLDRGTRKRCEFLRVEKRFKGSTETYEQIFSGHSREFTRTVHVRASSFGRRASQ